MSMQAKPLAGRTIAVPETRELNTLVRMLESEGAAVLQFPLIAILDAPDPAPVVAWMRELAVGNFDDLIIYTGEGIRRLVALAERNELREPLLKALGAVRKFSRGPKPARALRELGLQPDLPAAAPTTAGLIETLRQFDLSGRRIGVQLFAPEPPAEMIAFLKQSGATFHFVAPYVYAPASDAERVVDLIGKLEAGAVDVLAFTSASQVDRLWQVAADKQLQESLNKGIARTIIAAVGPVVADRLREQNVQVPISPADHFFMRPLVNAIIEYFETQSAEGNLSV